MGLQLWLLGTRAAAAVRQQQQQQQPAVRGTISAAIFVCAPGIRRIAGGPTHILSICDGGTAWRQSAW